ncbi:MAG: hypothetical protein ACXVC7_06490, partial [Bacteroidia bacterium]
KKENTYFLIALGLILVLRVLWEFNFPVLTSDNSIQLEAAKNYLRIGSFSHAWVEASNLNTIKSSPLELWPVGFPMIIVALNSITGSIFYSEILFQVIGIILFVTGIIKVLRLCGVENKFIIAFMILYSFSSTPFLYAGSTDLFTAALFTWIMYLVIKEINSQRNSWITLLTIALLSFIAAILRFACIPNLVIVPLVFLTVYFLSKKTLFLKQSFIIFSISLILTFLFYKVFPIAAGRTSFVDNIKHGVFYFSHLKWFDPFSIKSFFYMRPIEFRLPHNPTIIFVYRLSILLLSVSLTLLILAAFINKLNIIAWIKKLKHSLPGKPDILVIIFIITFIIIAGFISLQSLTVAPESNSFGPSWMPPFWTHVYSTRYFIYIMTLLIVLFFTALSLSLKTNKTTYSLLKYFYLVALVLNFGYWIFTNYQFYSPKGNGAGSEWVNEKTSITAYNEIKKIKSADKNAHIVFAHYRDKMIEGLVTNYSDAYPTDDYKAIIENRFTNTTPVILVMTMPAALNESENLFLAGHKHTVLSTINNEQIIRINL